MTNDFVVIPSRARVERTLRECLLAWVREGRITVPVKVPELPGDMDDLGAVMCHAALLDDATAHLAGEAADHVWHYAAQPDTRLRATEDGCPCLVLPPEECCHPRCTCVFPASSVGCRHCVRYGSMEQRLAQARRIAYRLGRAQQKAHAVDSAEEVSHER